MAFSSSGMFCVIPLLYADLRRAALLATTVHIVVNAALTALLPPLGFSFYAYGALLAAVAEFAIAYACLQRKLPWLSYHILSPTTPASAKPRLARGPIDLRSPTGGEGLFDVPDQVVGVLGSDGKADLLRLDAGQPLLGFGQLAMGDGGGMHHQRF